LDRIDALRAFERAHRAGSFAAAARALGLTRSAISKLVAGLEEQVGAPLFNRSTRALALTSAGEILLSYAAEIVALTDEATQTLAERSARPSGRLRVNAPMSYGTRVLAPLVPRFLRQYPEVELRLELDDRLVDPIEHGFDLTLRIAAGADGSLAARTLCPVPRQVLAAPQWLATRDPIRTPADLARHPCLHYGHSAPGAQWRLVKVGGGAEAAVNVQVHGPLCANNGDVLIHAAEAGLGLALLPTFIAQDALARGALVAVLPDWQKAPAIHLHALWVPTRRQPLALRALVDFLSRELSSAP